MNERAPYRLDIGCPPRQRVAVDPAVLARVEELYDAGRYLDAHAVAEEAAPLVAWKGTAARVLASRLASRLEGDRLSRLLSLTAWRESPRDARACLYRAYDYWREAGPLAVWEFTEGFAGFESLTPELEADFLAVRARIAGSYRDFELAGRLIAQAKERAPGSAWLCSENAALLVTAERWEEAGEEAVAALAIQPWFRPAVQMRAVVMQKQRRMEAAAAWLDEARGHSQSAEIIGQCIGVRREMEDTAGMVELLDAYEAHALLIEAPGREWLAARRCDIHCLRGEWAEAAAQAELAKGPYFSKLAEKLRQSPAPVARRVRLTAPHVVQRHNTCGPSTLAMLAGFWHHEATHDVIADAICYDGTYDHSERQWCLDNGLAAREFTVTWDSARALLDAGIPFAMATVEVNSAHMQAVVGYDDVRGTFLIQDPSSYLFRETIAAEMLKEYAMHGPRGLAVVPGGSEARLDGIPLPDADAFDRFFAFNSALHHHRRDEAAAILDAMIQVNPDHRIRHQMDWAMAWYDDNDEQAARATEAMARLFPDDPRLVARRSRQIRRHGSRADVLAFLRESARAENAHPAQWRDLAIELASDARDEKEAWKWLRKAHAAMPSDTGVIDAWAELWWTHGHRARATDAYGFAASWAPANEALARAWFNAERLLGRRDEAMGRLRARYRLLGHQSPEPGRTLVWTLDDFHHDREAELVLEETLSRHPDDGPLQLDAAAFRRARGDHAAAARHLAAAESRCPPGVWLRARARAEDAVGNHAGALEIWRQVAEREPMAVDAHGAIARILSMVEGDPSARAHLDAAVARFPHHFGLLRLRLDWLREAGSDRAEQAVRDLLAAHPSNAWASRELAIILGELGRLEEAESVARAAHTLAPREAASSAILAGALAALGKLGEAAGYFRAALECDVDYPYAMRGLLSVAADACERKAALEFIRARMLDQVLSGPSVSCYRELAFPLLDAEALLEQLREIHQARPDIYESWSVLTRHLLDMGRTDEARALAAAATDRFARVPGAWLNAARTHRVVPDWPPALACARTATELNPDWPDAWLVLADYTEDSGDPDGAVVVLESAIRRNPTAPSLRSFLAGLFWRLGQRSRAFDEAMTVAKRFPGESAAWHRAEDWGEALGRRDEVVAAAREVCRERPGEAQSWMILARALPRSALGEILSAFDRAIALSPRMTEAYDLKALYLASQSRFAEAEAACRPPVFGDSIPFDLLGRAAWIRARRGNTAEAIAAMEKVLADHPDYHWGWQCLLDWAGESRDTTRAATARAALVRLAPNDLQTICEAGDAELAAGREDEASRYFLLAMARDPGAGYPLNAWLRLRWKHRDVAAITDAAAKSLPGIPRAITSAFLVLTHAHAHRVAEMNQALDALLVSPEPIGGAVADLERGLTGLGYASLWHKALARAVRRGDIGMAFATAWIEAEIKAKRYSAWKFFDGWIARAHELAVPPIARFWALLGNENAARKASGFFATPAARWAHSRTEVFGQVGYALANARWWKKSVDWLAGAESRDDTLGWLCTNLMLAHSETDNLDEACAVARRVVDRGLRDHTWPCTAAVAALGHALEGNPVAARQLLDDATNPDSANFWKWKWELARHLSDVLSLPPGPEAAVRQAQAIRDLKKFARNCSRASISAVQARHFRRVLNRMAAHSGRRLRPWDRFLRFF